MKRKAAHAHHGIDIEGQLKGCTAVLHQHKARVTQPRLALLRCLLTAKKPLTPREILQHMQGGKKNHAVDQVSIYRNLEALSELGLVHQVSPTGAWVGCSHVACERPFHMLVRCSQCQATQELDIPKEVFSPLADYLAKNHAFKARTDLLQIEGLCGRCV